MKLKQKREGDKVLLPRHRIVHSDNSQHARMFTDHDGTPGVTVRLWLRGTYPTLHMNLAPPTPKFPTRNDSPKLVAACGACGAACADGAAPSEAVVPFAALATSVITPAATGSGTEKTATTSRASPVRIGRCPTVPGTMSIGLVTVNGWDNRIGSKVPLAGCCL